MQAILTIGRYFGTGDVFECVFGRVPLRIRQCTTVLRCYYFDVQRNSITRKTELVDTAGSSVDAASEQSGSQDTLVIVVIEVTMHPTARRRDCREYE